MNVEVSSPGATLALGLMFCKSNNASVAARLAIPNSHFMLEYVRADFILLRVVSRSLVVGETRRPPAPLMSKLPSADHVALYRGLARVYPLAHPAAHQRLHAARVAQLLQRPLRLRW